jgi:hypothetical protein
VAGPTATVVEVDDPAAAPPAAAVVVVDDPAAVVGVAAAAVVAVECAELADDEPAAGGNL